MYLSTDAQKDCARKWFESMRDQICDAFEAIERDYEGPFRDQPPGKF